MTVPSAITLNHRNEGELNKAQLIRLEALTLALRFHELTKADWLPRFVGEVSPKPPEEKDIFTTADIFGYYISNGRMK